MGSQKFSVKRSGRPRFLLNAMYLQGYELIYRKGQKISLKDYKFYLVIPIRAK